MCITHEAKAAALAGYFKEQLGSTTTRQHTLNWNRLQLIRHDLHDLDRDITEQEIYAAILATAPEKAPGPDGYIGAFFKVCWDIIKVDLIDAIFEIFALRAGCWNLLNSANIILLQKKDGAQSITDYRPISMMHNISKLLAKILANRLAPRLDSLVLHSHSAFIKGRSIQDNFQYVKGAANHFYQAKTPMLLLKLDITKAFDSVRWEYLLEVMEQIGFGQRWRDIMALIWSTSSSRIVLNREPGRPIKHGRGLHQGDLLSPMLFILTMDPLQQMLSMATQQGLLTPIGSDPIKMQDSGYTATVQGT
jgi:hypothetical protein